MRSCHLGSCGCPGLLGHGSHVKIKAHRLHHLSHRTVCQDHGSHAVLVGELESLYGELSHLLNGGRRQNDHAEVSVTAGTGRLEVVGLAGLNTTKSGAASLNVDHQRGKICACEVRKSLTLERDSGAGGGGHHAVARRCNSVHHVDGGDFTLRLQEGSPDLGHTLCHVRRDLGLGSNRISKVMTATCDNGSLSDCLVSFHQNLFRHCFSSLFYRNDAIGAHGSAECASDACALVGHLYGMVSFLVDFIGCEPEQVLRAGIHTQTASLADVGLEG